MAKPVAVRFTMGVDPQDQTTILYEPPSADRSPALLYLARLATGSRRTMLGSLDLVARQLTGGVCDAVTMPWHTLRRSHTEVIWAEIRSRYAPATANKILAALKGTLKEAWRLGLMEADDYIRASDITALPNVKVLSGRTLSKEELRAVLAACQADESPSGLRDAALLIVLYSGGLKRSEAAALHADDLDMETGALRVRRDKENVHRTVYIAPSLLPIIAAWLKVQGTDSGPLFASVGRYGDVRPGGITAQAIMMTLRKRAEQAGVKPFTPHDLRHTMIAHLLDAGVDIVTVQKLAGHVKLETTARYDRRGEDAKRAAMAYLDLVP